MEEVNSPAEAMFDSCEESTGTTKETACTDQASFFPAEEVAPASQDNTRRDKETTPPAEVISSSVQAVSLEIRYTTSG